MSTDSIFSLTAAVVVFGSFLGAVYFREIWKMARKSAGEPQKRDDRLPGDDSRPDHDFGP
jgi:hypothetical protein